MSCYVLFIIVIFAIQRVRGQEVEWIDSKYHDGMLCKDPEIRECLNSGTPEFLRELKTHFPPCRCDKPCAIHGDCCQDSEYFVPEEQLWGSSPLSCIKFKLGGNFYMMAKCLDDWKDNNTRTRCQYPDITYPDPLHDVPVTSSRSNITYRNGYCAICNKDFEPASDILWPILLECQDVPGQFLGIASLLNLTSEDNTNTEQIKSTTINVKHIHNLTDLSFQDLESRVFYDEEKSAWYLNVTGTPLQFTNLHHETLDLNYHDYENSEIYFEDEYDTVGQPHVKRKKMNFAKDGDFEHGSHYLEDADFYDDSNSEETGSGHDPNLVEIDYPFFYNRLRQKHINLINVHNDEEKHLLASAWDLRRCSVKIKPTPRAVKDIVRNCNKNLIAKCPSTWHDYDDDDNTKQKCESYTYYTKEQKRSTIKIFRNPHCNTCNSKIVIKRSTRKELVSFTELLNHAEIDEITKVLKAKLYNSIPIICKNILKRKGFEELRKEKMPKVEDKKTLAYTTNVGLGVSIACLVLHLLIFMATPNLRTSGSTNIASLSVALLLLYISFIISGHQKPPCITVAVFVHYSLLATFCWMLTIAFDVWFTVRKSVNMMSKISEVTKWTRFYIYSAFSWIIPLAVVGMALITEFYLEESNIQPRYGGTSCWFQNGLSLLVFVVAPLCIVMALNVVFYSWSVYLIYSSKYELRKITKTTINFGLFIRIAVIMGLTWITGLIAEVVKLKGLWYVFVVLNTLQGFSIFITFSCRRKVWTELLKTTSGFIIFSSPDKTAL